MSVVILGYKSALALIALFSQMRLSESVHFHCFKGMKRDRTKHLWSFDRGGGGGSFLRCGEANQLVLTAAIVLDSSSFYFVVAEKEEEGLFPCQAIL